MDKKPCTRCLLEMAGKIDIKGQIEAQLAKIKADERADDEAYQARLGACLACDHLQMGTCLKCGCYVELRAAIKKNHCPLVKRAW